MRQAVRKYVGSRIGKILRQKQQKKRVQRSAIMLKQSIAVGLLCLSGMP